MVAYLEEKEDLGANIFLISINRSKTRRDMWKNLSPWELQCFGSPTNIVSIIIENAVVRNPMAEFVL